MNMNDSNNYKNAFEKFLKHTNEKLILLSEIEKYLGIYKVESLLDVGAGSGEISVPLAKKVPRYLAVEKNPEFVTLLNQAGIETIAAEFPIAVQEKFDMVLASHTISYRRPDFTNYIKGFIQTAWDLIESKGVFLVINSEGGNDDWYRFLKEIGEEGELEKNKTGYQETLEQLALLGEVKIEKVSTYVTTSNMVDTIDALAFVAGKGDPLRKDKILRHEDLIEKLLKQEYATPEGFSFPVHHYFHLVQKS